jgi:cell division septal protein FtsQ
VSVVERRPAAIARFQEDLYVVDDRGAVIDQFGPNYAELDLPIVDGLAMTPASGVRTADQAGAVLVARVLGALQTRPDLAARVSQIDVSDARNAVLLLKGEGTLIRLGDERFVERLQSYVDLASTLRDRVAAMDYVDLRFDERIYVRPQSVGRRRGE